jgi:hypothetical protein
MSKLITIASASLVIGCGSPYAMMQQAQPSPFMRMGCRAVLEPLHTKHLIIGAKSEDQYMADKSESSAGSYVEDKRESDAVFHEAVSQEHAAIMGPGAPDNTFVIRPVWNHWEPGFYAFVAAAPGVAKLTVDVLSPTGIVLDRIAIETKASDVSSGGRMKGALRKAGNAVSVYITENWACAMK